MGITLNNLNVIFGHGSNRVAAVSDVSLDIKPGESYGLVGESGSGKSTVLRSIAGLVRQATGDIVINGHTVKKNRPGSLRKQVQLVFQDPYGSLHPRHTVDQILREPVSIHRLGSSEQRVNQALDEVGLDSSFRFRYPHQISGGQRQRVAIARALIIEPEIILLDEPTSALDVSVQAEVLNLLSSLRKKRNLTYLLVSHDLAVVSHMCDRLSVMQHGSIVETLSVEQLRNNQPQQPYTRQLLMASKGYSRATVDTLEDGWS